MFSKQPKNITNNYHNVFRLNNEIDYKKLADAIVKAQQKAEEQKEFEKRLAEENTPKLSFCDTLKLIWLVICNKVESNGTMTSGFLGLVMTIFFNLLAFLGLIILIAGFIAGVMTFKNYELSLDMMPANIITVTVFICFEIFVLTISFVFRCIANEIGKEKDRNYIVAVFSGVVSFAALVVALVALLKGIL